MGNQVQTVNSPDVAIEPHEQAFAIGVGRAVTVLALIAVAVVGLGIKLDAFSVIFTALVAILLLCSSGLIGHLERTYRLFR